jgi:hypothetical protein
MIDSPHPERQRLKHDPGRATLRVSRTSFASSLRSTNSRGSCVRSSLREEDRYENTAEQSWQIALFALSLAQVVEISVDVNRVIAMLIMHDLGEIDAGDKFVLAQDGWEDRKGC